MGVTIIIPIYNPDKEVLEKIRHSIKNQKYAGKIDLIEVDKGWGLADSMNWGIKKAKTKIVITLHQDCVPSDENWLKNLIEPLKKKEVIASVSKVELPLNYWNGFGLFARIMSVKEQKIITPLLDEKGCAYKKKALLKVGLFDGKTFRSAGEDFDMWIKLRRNGEIVYPNAKVLHYHGYTFKKRIKKEYQLSEGFGVLVKLYGKEMPKRNIGFVKSIPIAGWPVFLFNFPFRRMKLLSLLWIPLSLIINFIYCFGFWKGFLSGEQTI